jgi:ribose transport system substrate-binding protein
MTVDYRDENIPKPLPEIDLNIALPYARAGRLMADWMIADSNGNVNALIVFPSDALAGVDVANACADELKKLSPKSKVRRIGVTFPDRPQLGTKTLVELTKHPDVNYVVGCFDSLTLQVQPAIALAAASGSKTAKRIKIVSFNAIAAVMTMLQKREIVAAEVGAPNIWHGWAQIDAALRLMTNSPLVKTEGIGLRIFDRTNLGAKFNLSAPEENWYGPNFRKQVADGFKQLWRV